MSASSISRRMEDSVKAFMNEDYETSLIHYFPALDKTAKRRRPSEGVGNRIRNFLDDELDIISHVATRNILRIECDGLSIPQAIYKFGRTSIAHEGELDSRLNFNNKSGMSIGQTWNLPPSFITGLILSVVIAPENVSEKFENEYKVNIQGTEFNVSELWGQRQKIRAWMETEYGRPIFNSQL
jgi:hypothetical protein